MIFPIKKYIVEYGFKLRENMKVII